VSVSAAAPLGEDRNKERHLPLGGGPGTDLENLDRSNREPLQVLAVLSWKQHGSIGSGDLL